MKTNIFKKHLRLLANIALITTGLLGSSLLHATEKNWPTGIWDRDGYGQLMVVKENGRVKFFDYTRETCLLSHTEDISDILGYYRYANNRTIEGMSTVIARTHGAIFNEFWDEVDRLPPQCNKRNRINEHIPTRTFNHFSNTFLDYYAFFNEREIDWTARLAKVAPRIHDGMSKGRLRRQLRRLIKGIDDGHITLTTGNKEYSPGFPDGKYEDVLRKAFNNQRRYKGFRKYRNVKINKYYRILNDYLDHGSVQQAGGEDGDNLMWGTIGCGSVSYLSISDMEALSKKPDPSERQDVRAARKLMNRIMNDFENTQALVIDLRFNTGGWDSVAFTIANRFTDISRMAVSKNARSYKGESKRSQAFIKPEGDTPYLRPVALIIGPDTASAAEVFTLAMRALPQDVFIVGQPSEGIFSDMLTKELPVSRWEFTLSNEVYYDYLGNDYEGTGIPPDVYIPVFDLEDLRNGRNSALEAALDILKFGSNN